jgi:hypothetical protein
VWYPWLMAEVVDVPNPPWRRKRDDPPPELKWMDGQTWALTPGVDFTCTIATMRAKLWHIADRNGRILYTFTRDGVLYVRTKP